MEDRRGPVSDMRRRLRSVIPLVKIGVMFGKPLAPATLPQAVLPPTPTPVGVTQPAERDPSSVARRYVVPNSSLESQAETQQRQVQAASRRRELELALTDSAPIAQQFPPPPRKTAPERAEVTRTRSPRRAR
jgi:hypothetical protein